MTSVTLITPPFSFQMPARRTNLGEIPSLGVAYLAAFLRHHHHRVQVIDGLGEGLGRVTRVDNREFDLHGLSPQEIVERISQDVQVIGVSCMFSRDWKVHKDLIHRIRQRFPKTPIVAGGEHATADAEFVLRSGVGVDLCVLGEGEETLLEIVSDPETALTRDVPGTAVLKGGRYVAHPRRKRMEPRADLFPAWDLFPMQNWMSHRGAIEVTGCSTIPILASRGCPYACTFCSAPSMWGHKYVVREPAEIVREMKFLHERYQNEHFVFIDLSMTIKRDWTLALAREIIAAGLKISWHFGSGTRTEIMDAEVLALLKKSGLSKLGFAAESGSDATVEKIKKRVDLNKMYKSMRLAVKMGIPCRTTIIYGFPGQTLRECIRSLFFSLKLVWVGLDEVYVYFFAPYPGSELHSELLKSGAIPDKLKEPAAYERFLDSMTPCYYDAQTRVWGELAPRTLVRLHFLTHFGCLALSILSHPSKLIRAYRNVKSRRALTIFETVVLNRLYMSEWRLSRSRITMIL